MRTENPSSFGRHSHLSVPPARCPQVVSDHPASLETHGAHSLYYCSAAARLPVTLWRPRRPPRGRPQIQPRWWHGIEGNIVCMNCFSEMPERAAAKIPLPITSCERIALPRTIRKLVFPGNESLPSRPPKYCMRTCIRRCFLQVTPVFVRSPRSSPVLLRCHGGHRRPTVEGAGNRDCRRTATRTGTEISGGTRCGRCWREQG